MTVRLTATAARQLAALLAYIHERNAQGARRVAERMEKIIGVLSDYLLTGEATDRPGERRMVVGAYPYAVFHRVRGDEVVVQRIRHTARRPE